MGWGWQESQLSAPTTGLAWGRGCWLRSAPPHSTTPKESTGAELISLSDKTRSPGSNGLPPRGRINHLEVGSKEPQFGGKCDGIHPKCLGRISTGYPHYHLCSSTQTKPSPGVLCMWPILTPGPAASGKAYLPCSCPGSCQQLGTWAHPWRAVLGAP